ncbi:hypothetical protein L540_05490 [Bordetella pseudohinzii]|nr:hypothetical protein L540_05490 [Bordetella pseudohinzii]
MHRPRPPTTLITRSRPWSPSRPAAPPTRSRAAPPPSWPAPWASPSWSRTGPAPAATSAPNTWCAPNPTAIRSSSIRSGRWPSTPPS